MKLPLILNKTFFAATFNLCLFLLLIIGIQNSSNKSRVNLVLDQTIELPVSFIVGISFITGSLTGGFLSSNFHNKK